MNQSTCPICLSKQARPAFLKFGYQLFECHFCHSLYVFPNPSFAQLSDYYNNNKEEGQALSTVCWTETLDSHRHVINVWKQCLDYIQNLSGHGSLLDIGCGSGQFLQFARTQGWSDLSGIELVSEIAEKARKLSGASIYTTDLLDNSFTKGSFDGIILWDVIEHLNNIQEVLQEAFCLLKPGGVIVISTVNRSGFSMRILNQNSLTVNPPEHLAYFTRKGMFESLSYAGFKIVKQWTFSIYIREWINVLSKLKLYNHSPLSNTYKSATDYSSNLTQSKLFIILMTVMNYFLGITNLGDELVAIAQKPASKS